MRPSIAWTVIVDCVVGYDLVFGLLQFHHLAELVRLASLAFADHFRCRLEQARAMSSTRSFTLRLRSRNLAPTSPAILVIFFIVRVSTRTPSPNRLESVG